MNPINPWTARFASLLDPERIRELSRFVPSPLTDLDQLPVEVASMAIMTAFKQLFVPTAHTIAILLELVGIALAHAHETYPSAEVFIERVYAKGNQKSLKPDLSDMLELAVIVCLTGLAGVGKSHVIKALRRILGTGGRVLVDTRHTEFPLVAGWFLNVREKTTIGKMYLSLLGKEEGRLDALSPNSFESMHGRRSKERNDISRLLASCRFLAYRDGVSILPADEFQFVTRSERANALATSMLLHLALIGPPLIYVANFSLGHRLLSRPHEDVQRLLERRIVLLPDTARSVDWLNTVVAYKDIAPEVFVFNPEEIAETIHGWTAGLKRLLGRILIIAYRRARATGKCVGLPEIEWAYHSESYSVDRKDVDLIDQQYVTNKMARKDLWCPFELSKPLRVKEEEDAARQRRQTMSARLVTSALTQQERETYEQLQKAAEKSTPSSKGRAVSMPNRVSMTSEDLRRGEEIYRMSKSDRNNKS